MLAWVTSAIWDGLNVLAFILQLVGVLGVLIGSIMVLMDISEIILEVTEENGESKAGSGEEDPSVQQGL